MTHYGQATIEQATRLSLEHEYRNGNTTLTTPEPSELREDGFLAKASLKRKHVYTRKEVNAIMSTQPFKTGLGRYVEAARTRDLKACLTQPEPLGSVTCTNIKFRN